MENKVVPWANIQNGDFIGDVENNQVVDFKGPPEHWLCPNAPDVAQLWQKTFPALKQNYGYDTFLIDRIRFPDWAGKRSQSAGLFTCFALIVKRKWYNKTYPLMKSSIALQL